MLKIIRIIAIGSYVAGVMSLGILFSLFRPRHPNNVYLISKMLAWKGFDILGIEYDRRDYDLHENIGAAVFCSNHQNNIDMFPGGSCVHKNTVVLGKKSIIWIPFFGQFFWLSGNILIDRSNPFNAKKSMEKVTEKIRNEGISVWVMPEGTRSKGRGLLPFKKGAFVTAIAAQCPIAPVVFSSYAKRINLNNWKSGKIIAKCLPLISTVGMTKEDVPELMEKTRTAMLNCQIELDREIYD
ncbi:MAG: 1-acyl-sn-glycerol-3-phosphate acyltransferase [Halobacteriovorax sp.]|nr:1-acyl-sn-glycerol-3-phosphate acyltransferase [Halobacteriovorax sp.]|tara:strand:- start:29091 stop:29810 length:720 start_codon:yes stop_codon:yes gene_type:complete